jgi:GTP-binding protein
MIIRNIAIIAHVDHGKTTLVDALLEQGGAYAAHEEVQELVMDSNDQEKERGITIYAKNTSIRYKDCKINIVDTPGHADFGSEVERILQTVDCVLLLVDAQEGPMPQTKFVLKKSLEFGMRPIVVLNKIDKAAARPSEVVDEVFDLFVALGAKNEQLDFPLVYAIAREGIAKKELSDQSADLTPLLDTIMEHVAPAVQNLTVPFRMQPCRLDYDKYVGRMGIGRVAEGKVSVGESVHVKTPEGKTRSGRITKIYVVEGLHRREVQEALAGDMVILSGIPDIDVGETITTDAKAEPLPAIAIDPPTIAMTFSVNTSPFAGREGKFLTTRHIRDRLLREKETNVGLIVEDIEGQDAYKVSGRGELHLAVLIESMRREGFELQVSRPQVLLQTVDGVEMEPIEQVIVDVPEEYSGKVITLLSSRKGEMVEMHTKEGQTRMEFAVPTRGLLGFRGEFIIETRGEGILTHAFMQFAKHKGTMPSRSRGSMISMENGETMAFSLWNLQERGILFVKAQTPVYEGMIIGESAKSDDMVVNPTKNKKLTNVRASGTDEAMNLTPVQPMTLEQAIEYVADDELVEITPTNIRLRKKALKEHERRRTK